MEQATDAMPRLPAAGVPVMELPRAGSRQVEDRAASPAQAASPRIGIVRNPRSHRNKGHDAIADEAIAGDLLVESPRNRAQLAPALARLAAAGIGILVIDGGDGTIRDVLTHGARVFGSCWPQLVILPKGKTNALAVDLGLPAKWSLAQALAAAGAGRVVRRRPLVIERVHDRADAGDGTDGLWGFIFGAGAFNAAIATGQVAHRFGAFQDFAVGVTFAMGLGQALFGLGGGAWRKVSPMRLDGFDGASLPHSGRGKPGARYLALFSTLRRFPAGIMPFRRTDRDIRYLVIDSPLRRVVARLPAILRGGEAATHPGLGVHRGAGEEFVLDLAEDGFILDGEAFAPGRLRLRQGPALQFITP